MRIFKESNSLSDIGTMGQKNTYMLFHVSVVYSVCTQTPYNTAASLTILPTLNSKLPSELTAHSLIKVFIKQPPTTKSKI
jgi:hypothetical protein